MVLSGQVLIKIKTYLLCFAVDFNILLFQFVCVVGVTKPYQKSVSSSVGRL